VHTELQATISRELGLSEVDGRKIIDIIPILQQTLLKSFQNYLQGVQLGSGVGRDVESDEDTVLQDASCS